MYILHFSVDVLRIAGIQRNHFCKLSIEWLTQHFRSVTHHFPHFTFPVRKIAWSVLSQFCWFHHESRDTRGIIFFMLQSLPFGLFKVLNFKMRGKRTNGHNLNINYLSSGINMDLCYFHQNVQCAECWEGKEVLLALHKLKHAYINTVRYFKEDKTWILYGHLQTHQEKFLRITG